MSNLRQRLAVRRERLVVHGATLRRSLSVDMAGLQQRLSAGARILSLLSIAQPLFAWWWRRRRR